MLSSSWRFGVKGGVKFLKSLTLGKLWNRQPITEAALHGQIGEREAARYLKREKGFKVLARNWRSGRDEIDLVCKEGKILVFVEVKTRNEQAKVPGYYTVDARKKQALKRVCKAYMQALRHQPKHFRLDVVEVRLKNTKEQTINHYSNVSLF